jgi:hypothetical protein
MGMAAELGTDRTENVVSPLQNSVCWGDHVITTEPLLSNDYCIVPHFVVGA